ncbi:hypothetical protein H072_7392 [Dactylellina haptotyla CBS 200.50]|uniref:RNase III domain-containing protein n=1 Tax=Dactylellina haptotyla (strain CBS 200.50) TaxID=1284197 RepID=S8A7U1_DACHA|nr:hypothetical protein H072_7392 [Dactylellina haptotyla CBS 200.50]
MYTSSSRSPPQSRSTSPWYSRFPDLDPVEYLSRNWPPAILEIVDPELQRIAFLPRNTRSPLESTDVKHNGRAGYLGEGLLTALISDFLYTEFVEYSDDDLMAMRQALLDPVAISNLCQRVGLQSYLPGSPSDRRPDDHTLAMLFEAYIGGVYHDRGPSCYQDLREWFHFLIRPYAMMCKNNYDTYVDSHRSARDPGYSPSSSSRHGRGHASGHPDYALEDPRMIARPGTAAPGLGMYATASALDARGSRARGDYIKDLKEYCEKRRYKNLVYHDEDNGQNGDFIRWWSKVYIDGSFVGESTDWGNTKKEARAQASKVALNFLRNRP